MKAPAPPLPAGTMSPVSYDPWAGWGRSLWLPIATAAIGLLGIVGNVSAGSAGLAACSGMALGSALATLAYDLGARSIPPSLTVPECSEDDR